MATPAGGLAESRANKTAAFSGGMESSICDLETRKKCFIAAMEVDADQIYQLELELQVLKNMEAVLDERIERRQYADKEFGETAKAAAEASKKLKNATRNLAAVTTGL